MVTLLVDRKTAQAKFHGHKRPQTSLCQSYIRPWVVGFGGFSRQMRVAEIFSQTHSQTAFSLRRVKKSPAFFFFCHEQCCEQRATSEVYT